LPCLALPGIRSYAACFECGPHGSVTPLAVQAAKYIYSWK